LSNFTKAPAHRHQTQFPPEKELLQESLNHQESLYQALLCYQALLSKEWLNQALLELCCWGFQVLQIRQELQTH
jgi:cell division inhibitor SulA